ncbi:MAG: NlpC/P60 family protein [Candidatus Zixiibacteriota bacterium]
MKYGYVNTNLLDLWSRPKFNSERLSQLFFGEPIAVKSSKVGFLCIRQLDGYTGWLDERFVVPVNLNEIEHYHRRVNAVISANTAVLYGPEGNKTAEPFFLYYGTRLYIKGKRGGHIRAVLPDNRAVFLKSSNVRPINMKMSENIKRMQLAREAIKFLGVPYLWGGISPAGFDCSGLIRTVCSRFGIDLPRDTKDQIKAGRKIERAEVQSGDLLFFNRHVGFALGPEKIIHSSISGGGVRINSLRSGAPNYREDLDRNYNQARRIL